MDRYIGLNRTAYPRFTYCGIFANRLTAELAELPSRFFAVVGQIQVGEISCHFQQLEKILVKQIFPATQLPANRPCQFN